MAPVHARGQNRRQILILFVAASASQHGPEIGLIHVLGHAASAPVERSQFGLGGKAAVICRAAEPAESLLLVACDVIFFVSLKVAQAESILSVGIALFRHFLKLRERRGLPSRSTADVWRALLCR